MNANTFNFMPNSPGDVASMVYHNSSLENEKDTQHGMAFQVGMQGPGSYVRKLYPKAADWSAFDGVSVTLENNGSTTATIQFRLDTTNPHGPVVGSETMQFIIEPGMTHTYLMWFNPGTTDYNFREPIADIPTSYQWAGSVNNQCNFKTVYQWQIWNVPNAPSTITVDNLTLIHKRPSLNGMIDQYGQYAWLSWTGKTIRDADLTSQANSEIAALNNEPVIAEVNGTTQLPNMGAQGKWRLAKSSSGNWFFVHPNGNPFWSFGCGQVGYDAATITDNRQGLFQQLPEDNPQWGTAYGSRQVLGGAWVNTVDFHIANLQKKFQANWLSEFNTLTNLRLPRWGINTVGVFSMPQFCGSQMPYVRLLATDGFPTRLNVPYAVWRQLPDPFDPTFKTWMVTNFTPQLKPFNGQTNFMGVYVDNEQSWCYVDHPAMYYQIPIAALNAGPGQPAKAAFMATLEAKYGTIGALNDAWGTAYASWNALDNTNGCGTPALNAPMQADFSAFLTSFANQYYGTVRAALTQMQCSALYLGSRNVVEWTPTEFFNAAEQYVDAHSVNVYARQSTSFPYIATLHKPVILSEYCTTAVDRGHCAYGMPTETGSQADRATDVDAYLRTALSIPNVVGVHYLSYMDMEACGRAFDLQRWNAGLVDVTDAPFPEMVAENQAIGKLIYQLHN